MASSLALLGGGVGGGGHAELSPPPADGDEPMDSEREPPASPGDRDSSGSRSEDGSGSERPHAADAGYGSAKKRRKQSCPVKLGSGDSEDGGGDESAPGEPLPLRCPYCPLAFPSEAQFKYHIEVEHVRRMSVSDASAGESAIFGRELPLNLSSGPKMEGAADQEGRYHDAGTPKSDVVTSMGMPLPPSLQDKFPMPNFLQFGPPPFLLSFLQQQAGGVPVSQPPHGGGGDAPLKIFNPEAYCELCNKEFCNKYFLKTHKANKHGVYSDVPPGVGGAVGGLPGGGGGGGVGGAPGNGPGNGAGNVAGAGPVAGGGGGGGGNARLSPSGDSRDSGRPSSEADALRPPAGAHPDTFCEPCQKEFSEPYYLQRHRQLVHGTADVGPASGAAGDSPAARLPPDPYDSRQLLESAQSPSLLQQLDAAQVADHQTAVHLFMDKLAMNGEAPPKHLSKEQLQQIGVGNIEAFCNICWKEFCNKHFLKMHKYKMHVMSSPPPPPLPLERDRQPEREPERERNGDLPPCPPLETPSEMQLNDNAEGLECELCAKTFQSSYLLQMHRYYFHGSGPQNSYAASHPQIPATPGREDPRSPETADKKEHFSEDLKKLQGMIKGLNEKKGSSGVTCHICTKRMDSKNSLHAHLMQEHGMFSKKEELIIPKPLSSLTSSKPPFIKDASQVPDSPGLNGETVCGVCNKDFYAKFFLQQHMQTAHGIPAQGQPMNETAFLARIRLEVEGQKKLERPKPASTSRSYCEICNKELCNKYFMKTHMIKMHGINMDNHQSQAGVKCDVCQKELCSKYFLKVHKQNTHGIYVPDDDKSAQDNDPVIKEEEGLEICTVCSGKFKTAKLLEAHMASEHGAPKEKKSKSSSSHKSPVSSMGAPCSLCGHILPDLLSLRLHVMQVHPFHEQKAGDKPMLNGDVSSLDPSQLGDKLLRHPFGPLAGAFPPFLPTERLMGLLPPLGAPGAALLDAANTSPSSQQPLLQRPPPTSGRRPPARRPYRCKPCGLRFPQRHHYLSHWHQKHGHTRLPYAASLLRGYLHRNYRCARCGFSSRLRALVRRHVRRHHRRGPDGEAVPHLYALPLPPPTGAAAGYTMQSFLLQPSVSDSQQQPLLAPAYAVLPVFRRLCEKTELRLTLLPA